MKSLYHLKIPYLVALQYCLAEVFALSILAIGFSNQLIPVLTYDLLLFVIFISSLPTAFIKFFDKRMIRSGVRELVMETYSNFVVLIVFMVTLSVCFSYTLPNMPASNAVVVPAMIFGVFVGHVLLKIQGVVGKKLFYLVFRK